MVRNALAFLADKRAATPADLAKIKGRNWRWISSDPLFSVAIRLLAVHYANPQNINSTCLALLAKRLVATETASGGPYKDEDGRVDIATNIAIAQLLKQLGTLPSHLHRYICQHHDEPSVHASQGVIRWLLTWPSDLRPNSKDTYALKIGPVDTKNRYPSASLRVRETIKTLKEPLQSNALYVWDSVNRANRNQEITHIATFFAESLRSPITHTTKAFYHDLGEANFYAWMAYTIYDDLIDNNGQEQRLNVANVMHRRSLLLYAKHSPQTLTTWQYFDQMDEANAWELAYCRAKINDGAVQLDTLPNYHSLSMLAARSSAHILGPLIIAATANNHYETFKTVEQGLRHYLIARQLNDDLHDWKSDLSHGHLSSVVTYLLEKINIKKGRFMISDILPLMQRYFWQKGMVAISRRILYHTKKSRHLLLKDGFMNANTPFFSTAIDPIETSAKQAIAMQNANKKFLKIYTSLH